MNCRSVQNNLSAYLDRELSGAEMLAIRAHLADCGPCRQEEESLRTLKRLLAGTNVPEPSADLADRLCASVLSDRRTEPAPRPGVTWKSGTLTFVAVAGISMAITVGVRSFATAPAVPAPVPLAAAGPGQDLNFDVKRDEVYATGLDATSGVPILAIPDNDGR